MSIKLLKAFKQYDRWEIVDRDEKYPYQTNRSKTYMDKTTKAKFEVYKAGADCAIYYYGVGVCTDPEVITDFVDGVHKLLVESKLKELDELYANTSMRRNLNIAPQKLSISNSGFSSILQTIDNGHLQIVEESRDYKRNSDGCLYYELKCQFYPNL